MSELRICINCEHYADCLDASAGIDPIKNDGTCENWVEEVGLTSKEKKEIVGDREAHRIMVEGEEIL